MTALLRDIVRAVARFIVVWVVDTFSLFITAALLPGFDIVAASELGRLAVASAAALMLGAMNIVVRPIILLLARPFGWIVLFVVGFFVNALVLLIASWLVRDFVVSGVLSAILASLVIAVINVIITELFSINDDESFFNGVIARQAQREAFPAAADDVRGLLILEVDGLSVHHLRRAIELGYMPTFRRLMDEQGYRISRIDCGLPSQTSACQAGILFGDNFDIPSFRWVDKTQGKLYVSTKAAAELNARYAKGQGLARQGSSINNMLCGDASKSLLTFATLFDASPEEKKRRARDIYLLMLNPYFFMRVVVLSIADVILELWEGWNQRRRDEQPRLNRLHKFYPLVRAMTTVFLRDVSMGLISLDIMRGVPVIYSTYVGYDEVAHHSGTWSKDAFRTLRQFDAKVAQLLAVIERSARDYEVIFLSDHGQSFGATFKQRYGVSLQAFIESALPAGVSVQHSYGGDDGAMSVISIAGEISNMHEQGMGGVIGKRVIERTKAYADRVAAKRDTGAWEGELQEVVVCGSGNLAQVYFTRLSNEKVTLSQLKRAYPDLLDELVRHPGIGFVVAYDDEGVPLVFGKRGGRNLRTGQVTGEDPLAPYGDPDLRARQVLRVAEFPHAGDLIVNSTLYPDGTVAAMEELIGSHGGLGGEQTDAFIFHPPDMSVPETTNAADVFAILDARRNLPARTAEQRAPAAPREADSWAWSTFVAGIKDVPTWLSRAVGAATLSSRAYAEVARDPFMTGPALLIVAIAALLNGLIWQHYGLVGALLWLVSFFVSTLVAFLAARALGGKANFTQTLRAAGFARSVFAVSLLALIPPIADLVHIVVILLLFVSTWLGVAQAHRIRDWRTVVLPVLAVAVVFVLLTTLVLLLSGAAVTLNDFLRLLGLAS